MFPVITTIPVRILLVTGITTFATRRTGKMRISYSGLRRVCRKLGRTTIVKNQLLRRRLPAPRVVVVVITCAGRVRRKTLKRL